MCAFHLIEIIIFNQPTHSIEMGENRERYCNLCNQLQLLLVFNVDWIIEFNSEWWEAKCRVVFSNIWCEWFTFAHLTLPSSSSSTCSVGVGESTCCSGGRCIWLCGGTRMWRWPLNMPAGTPAPYDSALTSFQIKLRQSSFKAINFITGYHITAEALTLRWLRGQSSRAEKTKAITEIKIVIVIGNS